MIIIVVVVTTIHTRNTQSIKKQVYREEGRNAASYSSSRSSRVSPS